MANLEIKKKSHPPTVSLISLGCPKNLVDSEVMAGTLLQKGYVLDPDSEGADVVIVNTCSFIDKSERESRQTIDKILKLKKQHKGQRLVVTGCLPQKFRNDFASQYPDIDLIIGTENFQRIDELLETGESRKQSYIDDPSFIYSDETPRLNTMPGHTAYIKISEGCSRRCSFCIIPHLRCNMRSRSIESIVAEAKNLAAQGVKEINIVSQETNLYGIELHDKDTNLNFLLRALCRVEGVEWIRLYYLYPHRSIDDEFIDILASEEKIVKYVDMPLQHVSDPILKGMTRGHSGAFLKDLVDKMRERIPELFFRTSLIVGFPGEEEEDFEKLCAAVCEFKFDHLGVFEYSDETSAASHALAKKVDKAVIKNRFHRLMSLQKSLLPKIQKKRVGKTFQSVVEGMRGKKLLGRISGQAIDIDGLTLLEDDGRSIGEFLPVTITGFQDYDFLASSLGMRHA